MVQNFKNEKELQKNVDILQNNGTSVYLFSVHKKGDRSFRDYSGKSLFHT